MIVVIPALFVAAVVFNEVTQRMYARSLKNAGDDAMAEIQKEGCMGDLVRCNQILTKHYNDNDKNWRWRKR